jgi:DMSO/TMAO reductase YedYZ molybdopterin-dependent catalytic subunit
MDTTPADARMTSASSEVLPAEPLEDPAPLEPAPLEPLKRLAPLEPLKPLAPRWAAALAGVAGAAVAIGVSELLAGLLAGLPSLVVAIGAQVIVLQPPGGKELFVALFGENDKLVLNLLVVAAALAIAAIAGLLARRWPAAGIAVFVAFGCVAAVAAARDPLASVIVGVASAAVVTLAGIATMRALLRRASLIPAATIEEAASTAPVTMAAPAAMIADPTAAPAASSEPAPAPAGPGGVTVVRMPDWGRRRFLIASAGTIGGAFVAGAAGRALIQGQHPAGVVSTSRLPAALQPVPPLAADQSIAVPGITPIVVPVGDFYRIDTALLVPRVNPETWTLKVTGMVDRPLTFTYDELLALPLFEQYVTIACVSNRVGEGLVGNALWTGVRLKDILEMAAVQAGATQIVGRSVDRFTAGFPTDWATAPEREPMVAVGMDRLPLPTEHGFPARLIIPGLYGYVSATKWLSEIELTTREAVDGYWVPLGWAKDAPILTQSRIDVPGRGDRLSPGPNTIAGVAWAPDRGVSRVEVSIDDGEWQVARVSRPISDATWVQWSLDWPAEAGRHTLEVRATDGTDEVQTADVTGAAPDGARGHHRVTVQVG